jgi:tRNA 5-methylaminomethyl-2-thiouridine biosynthesis bifunctional protein
MEQTLEIPAQRPGLPAAPAHRASGDIGGGSPAPCSLALLRRGWQVTLYCADDAPHRAHPVTARARSIRC